MIGFFGLTFEGVFIILGLTVVLFVVVNLASLLRFILRKKGKIVRTEGVKPSKKVKKPILSHFSKGVIKLKGIMPKPIKVVLKGLYSIRLIFFDLILIAFSIFLFNDLFVRAPGVNFHNPDMNSYWNDQNAAFVIQFDRVYDEEKIIPQIYPEIAGEWKHEHLMFPFLKRKLAFYPEESILPGNNITIYIGEIKGLYQTDPTWDKVIDLKSPGIPEIVSTYPENEGCDFGVNEKIEIKLSSQDGNFMDWDFDIEPAADFQVVRNNSDRVFIEFIKPLAQSTTYKLTTKKTPQSYSIETGDVLIQEETMEEEDLSFTTIKAPTISNIEPVGDGVLVDSAIKIKFDFDMVREDVESNISIEPSVEYTISWEDGATIILKPVLPLEKEKDYTVKLPSGLKNLKGGVSEIEVAHSFRTVGVVRVASTSPSANATGRDVNVNISITFNQQVDKASAQSKFSITPAVGGAFSWNGNTMVFNPTASLAYTTPYTVNIAKGVKTVHGIDSNSDYSFKFTTKSQIFELNTIIVTQPYRYSCNLTASRIALNYKGVNVSVDTLYSQIVKDTTPYDEATNTWGNPNSGYVGSITGNPKGYGVYWGPIRNLISSYRPAETHTGWNRTALLQEVQNNNPVIIWAHNAYAGSGADISWNLPGGGRVYAVKGMHSFVVRGYIGELENPTNIILVDPAGRGRWVISTSYFDSLWNVFGRAAVVVK
ncbi:Ig-like domain-containing protein [Candidatus Dojkabacteria bacterium]|nr:Ig-like domain-containing protein [Candidatus Dojkabacteria bacterium]